jgi:hypothetical protein
MQKIQVRAQTEFAPLERLAQLAHRASAECVKDQAKFFPMESLLDILRQVVALEDDAVTSQTPYLLCRFGGKKEFTGRTDIETEISNQRCLTNLARVPSRSTPIHPSVLLSVSSGKCPLFLGARFLLLNSSHVFPLLKVHFAQPRHEAGGPTVRYLPLILQFS